MVSSYWSFRLNLVCLLFSTVFFTSPLLADSALVRQVLKSDLLTQSLLLDITTAGERLVAVGERGHIIYRDPNKAWQQAEVPVTSQLTGVYFPTPSLGFAVGHEAMILRSKDAGASWQLIHHDAEEAPLLDIYFTSENTGFAVGGYGLLLATNDSGNTWQNLTDELPNPDGNHNNAIIEDVAGNLFIAGERGSVYRSSDLGVTWQPLTLDYNGSIFGLVTTQAEQLIATGLRGNLFMSLDAGDSWQVLAHPGEQTLNTGLVLANNQLLLLGQNGEYLTGPAQALNLHTLPGRYSLLAAARQGNQIIAVGRGGLHTLALPEAVGR